MVHLYSNIFGLCQFGAKVEAINPLLAHSNVFDAIFGSRGFLELCGSRKMIEQKHVEFPPRRLANSPFSYAHVIPMITVISHFSALQMFPRELLGLKAKRNNIL